MSDLLDMMEGQALASQGMKLADTAEGDQWKHDADRAIDKLASTGEAFSATDVRALAGDPAHPNAVGSRFLAAARSGLIIPCGYTRSERASRHASRQLLWKGVE